MLSFFRYHIGRARFVPLLKAALMDAAPDLPIPEAERMARQTYNEWMEDEGILYGDPRYAWDAEGAAEIVQEYWSDQ